jgi:hypothetical protein
MEYNVIVDKISTKKYIVKIYLKNSDQSIPQLTLSCSKFFKKNNSFIVRIKKGEYLFIKNGLKYFKTRSTLLQFEDDKYPYAIDKDNRYYLLDRNIILYNIPEIYINDPYEVIKLVGGKRVFKNIKEFNVGIYIYDLLYTLTPNIDYDKLLESKEYTEFPVIYIKYFDGSNDLITREYYCQLMKEYSNGITVKPLCYEIINKI